MNTEFKQNQQKGKYHKLIDSDVLLIDKMKKMLTEGRSSEECLLVIAQQKCLSRNCVKPSEDEAQIMLQEPLIRSFCFREFSRIRAGLGF